MTAALTMLAATDEPDASSAGAQEAIWIERATDGDTRAFEALYRCHVGRVHGLCLRMCRDAHDAEECTQDTFVQAWRKLHLYSGESRLSTWLHRVAVNVVLQRMRKAGRHRDRFALLGDDTLEVPVPDESAGTRDIEAALKTLPGGARSVVVLCGIYGYTHAEASAMLGIAVGTCKAQLHRARQALSARLGQ